MNVIYEPKGAAFEYAPLALNVFKGCPHGCGYCYVPFTPYWRRQGGGARQMFHQKSTPRRNLLNMVANDCTHLRSDPRTVLLCFTCDPYPPPERCDAPELTRGVLQYLDQYGVKATVLTKGGRRAVRDFDVLARNDWAFGTSACLINEDLRRHFEPDAEPFESRKAAIVEAKANGIRTWVSMEPVLDHAEAVRVIGELLPYVDEWRVGKLNHGYRLSPELSRIENAIDWAAFRHDVEAIIPAEKLTIKDDLKQASWSGARS